MKKLNYIFLMLIITINTFGQSACDNQPYGISTNPDNPTNPHSPVMTNDFFVLDCDCDYSVQFFKNNYYFNGI